MKLTVKLKQKLYDACMKKIDDSIADDIAVMNLAQESANDEEKSSAGDKYETNRAMLQREHAMYERRLAEIVALKQTLLKIDVSKTKKTISPGAAVVTSMGNFFVAVSSDDITIDNEEWIPISAVSPLGEALVGKKTGERVEFRNEQVSIIGLV